MIKTRKKMCGNPFIVLRDENLKKNIILFCDSNKLKYSNVIRKSLKKYIYEFGNKVNSSN